MTTKYKIAEQILLLLTGGNPKAAASVELDDIMLMVGQVINRLFKQEQLTVNMPSGETIPDGIMLATYDELVPVKYKAVSKVTLPVTPVALPRSLGINHVSRSDDITDGFIPASPGELGMLKNERLISDVLGQVTYTPVGNDLIFNKDLTTESGTTILTRLAVFDIDTYDDYTPLPLPADMEGQIVQECFKLFASQIPEINIVDPSTERTHAKG